MQEKDSLSKELLSDPFVFADSFNGAFFGGKQVIAPDSLSEKDTTGFFRSMAETGKEKTHERRRDVLKMLSCKTSETTNYVILGIEEQSSVVYSMPVRTMGYEYVFYNKQVMEIANANRREKKGEVAKCFTSHLLPQDRLKPIVSLILFLSDAKWDGPRSLRELMSPFPPALEPLFNDHRLNLLCPADLGIEDIHRFQSDLGAVLLTAKYARDEEMLYRMISSDPHFQNITNATTEPLIRAISNYDLPQTIQEGMNMGYNLAEQHRKVSEYIYHLGEADGIKKGFQKGRLEGEKKGAIMGAIEVMLSMKIPTNDICLKMKELYSLTQEQVMSYINGNQQQ
ncbi:MAG: hypothetical protein IKR29_06630 [Bacteroidales bacterium]|nr:hypothetical protein [Bacteroidales bacterium]